MKSQMSRSAVAATCIPLLAGLIVATMPWPDLSAQNDGLRLPAPLFPEAVTRWQDGQPEAGLASLDRQLRVATAGPEEPPLEGLVLRASLLTAVGRAEAAETTWRAVVDREVWMRTFARRALVESLASRGEADRAESVLAELNRSDVTRHLDLTLRTAEAYQVSGDLQSARRLYQLTLDRQRRGAVADIARLGLAATLESEGDIDAAIAQYRVAKLEHRLGTTFQTAAAAEHRLVTSHGGSVEPLGPHEYRDLVRRLRNASRFESALTLVEEWRSTHAPTGDDPEIEAERIEILYAQRANESAVAASQMFYARFPDSPLGANVRLTDFRLAVRMVDTERARRTGLDLWEGRIKGATTSHRRDAANLLAAYLVAVGDLSGGLDLYRQLFRTAQSADDQREFLWRAGIAALRAGQHKRALTNLRALVDRGPSGDLAPAGLYWLALAEASTNAESSSRRLRSIVQQYPYHYYGIRAREELLRATNDPAIGQLEPSVTFPTLSLSTAVTTRPEYQAAMVLARAGLVQDAAWYLRRLLAGTPRGSGLALLAARASAAAEDQASVSRILANHFLAFLQRPAHGLPEDFWELAYPRPFWDDVSRAGDRQAVDPMLLTSLMRQESRFDPTARSPVGAVGLFQIMPYTAESLAESADVGDIIDDGRVDEAALARPSVNAAIAARLTANLLEMFDGTVAPVAASYNAGEERVAVWWAASRDMPEDFFVDTIPYSETRRFVREVLTNRAAYARIYGDQ